MLSLLLPLESIVIIFHNCHQHHNQLYHFTHYFHWHYCHFHFLVVVDDMIKYQVEKITIITVVETTVWLGGGGGGVWDPRRQEVRRPLGSDASVARPDAQGRASEPEEYVYLSLQWLAGSKTVRQRRVSPLEQQVCYWLSLGTDSVLLGSQRRILGLEINISVLKGDSLQTGRR